MELFHKVLIFNLSKAFGGLLPAGADVGMWGGSTSEKVRLRMKGRVKEKRALVKEKRALWLKCINISGVSHARMPWWPSTTRRPGRALDRRPECPGRPIP